MLRRLFSPGGFCKIPKNKEVSVLDWLEMHNLEFGECTVLGSLEGNILMVDCGSMNVKIRESDMEVTDYVAVSYTHLLSTMVSPFSPRRAAAQKPDVEKG